MCSIKRNIFALEVSENTDKGPDLMTLFNLWYLKEQEIEYCIPWKVSHP